MWGALATDGYDGPLKGAAVCYFSSQMATMDHQRVQQSATSVHFIAAACYFSPQMATVDQNRVQQSDISVHLLLSGQSARNDVCAFHAI